jgi:hypothetical protein
VANAQKKKQRACHFGMKSVNGLELRTYGIPLLRGWSAKMAAQKPVARLSSAKMANDPPE